MRRRLLLLALAACGGREPVPSAPEERAAFAPDAGAEHDEDYVRVDRCDESHGPNLDDAALRRAISRCYLDAGLAPTHVELRVTVEADGESNAVDVTGGPEALVLCVDTRIEEHISATAALGHAGCTLHIATPE
jgi:hypothetical protein